MVNRIRCTLALTLALAAVSATPAAAQQTLNASFGYSMMRNQRVATDILLIEHHDLAFEFADFKNWSAGVEWLVPIGEFFEAGAGVGFTRKTVPTVHVAVVNPDGSEIERDLTLRQMPAAFTVRVLPLRQSYSVQPYAGGGVAMINWRFSESGDFATTAGRPIFRNETYTATGNGWGPVMLAGFRVTGDRAVFGFEGRYQRARGSFGPLFARVVNPDIDLGGWTLSLTAGLRFGPRPPAIRR
jgi:hypothetical protein